MSIAISSCLDSDENYEYSSDATIRAFGIDSITKGVYYKFTIDQLKREIYNVDSLPMGADSILKRILIDTLTVTGWVTSGLNDTIFNMNDSVDLSTETGGITLKVHAADGITTREYKIWVNVHTQDPDSLIWREMPSLPASPASGKQRSVVLNEDLLVYTSTTTAYRTSVSNPNFESIQWGNLIISGLPSDTKLTSIINFNNRLYTTAESGKAFYSDNGTNWEEMDMQGMYMVTFLAGIPADEVTGSENMLTGIFAKDGKNFFCAKSAGETTWKEGEEVPSDFPLKEIYSTVFTNASGIKQKYMPGWFQNERGWKYVLKNGYFAASTWVQDTDGKYYYFDLGGYMKTDYDTPDGYHVGPDGVWDGQATTHVEDIKKLGPGAQPQIENAEQSLASENTTTKSL